MQLGQRNRNKIYEDWKRRNKVITSDDLLVYIENSKGSTSKLLEIINEFSKVPGYNVNIQKSIVFFYTSKRLENEIRIFYFRDFPGGAVVKTPCSQCRGPGFDPWSGN